MDNFVENFNIKRNEAIEKMAGNRGVIGLAALLGIPAALIKLKLDEIKRQKEQNIAQIQSGVPVL